MGLVVDTAAGAHDRLPLSLDGERLADLLLDRWQARPDSLVSLKDLCLLCEVSLEGLEMFDQKVPRITTPDAGAHFVLRPLVRGDLPVLTRDLGPTLDLLYPDGVESMIARLERTLANKAVAIVAATKTNPNFPVALASEVPKGLRRVKLSTLWVAPAVRKRGVGSLLLGHRVMSWIQADLESVHVTVRRGREKEIAALVNKFGFRPIAIDLSRYGDDEDEVVFQWRPEWMSGNSPIVELETLVAASG